MEKALEPTDDDACEGCDTSYCLQTTDVLFLVLLRVVQHCQILMSSLLEYHSMKKGYIRT